MEGTDIQALFHPQDLGQGDNIFASSTGGYRGRSQNEGSGSCKFLALFFRL